jgi:putative transposase
MISRCQRSGPIWRQFLAAQANAILAVDFAHVDTVSCVALYILVVIEHGRRGVHIAGITAHPTGARVTQQARNLLIDLGKRGAPFTSICRSHDVTELSALTGCRCRATARRAQGIKRPACPAAMRGRTPARRA